MNTPDYMSKAERKALRRVGWRAFWRGFLWLPSPPPKELSARFWADVQRFS